MIANYVNRMVQGFFNVLFHMNGGKQIRIFGLKNDINVTFRRRLIAGYRSKNANAGHPVEIAQPWLDLNQGLQNGLSVTNIYHASDLQELNKSDNPNTEAHSGRSGAVRYQTRLR